MRLKETYKKIKNEYIERFLNQTDYTFCRFIDDINVDLGSYVLDFYDIKYCIDNEIETQKLFDYHDYQIDQYYKSKAFVSFGNWLRGARNPESDKRCWTRNMRILENYVRKYADK